MAQGQQTPSDYDWEDRPAPSEPEPIALPDRRDGATGERPAALAPGDSLAPADSVAPADSLARPGSVPAADGTAPGTPVDPVEDSGPYGAPTFTYAPLAGSEEPARRRRLLPAWAIVMIVAVQAMAVVASVALVLGGIERMLAEQPAAPVAGPASPAATRSPPPSTPAPEREPGIVTDSSGREVTDGTGGYDDPATVGEHTLSWRAWTHGALGVTALEVDLEGTVPEAEGADVVQEGYRLVLVTYEVRYDGPGQLGPAEELWLTAESQRSYFPDIAEGLVDDPMRSLGPLQDGETARFRSAFLVPEAEVDSLRLGVETFSGEILYFATP